MRERQASVAELLESSRGRSGTLLDGRYRLDALVRRSAVTTLHAATHRNGASAWLKLPISAAHAGQIALETRIANAIASPLTVRDDGVTPEGLPYLVLDPPDGETLAALRARAQTGARLSIARAMPAGHALAGVVASLHALGYVTGGLAEEDILLLASDEIALLDLHAVVPATHAGLASDVARVVRLLGVLVDDLAFGDLPGAVRVAIDGVLTGGYPDLGSLQAAWRAVTPVPIKPPPPSRRRGIGFDSSPELSAHDTPMALAIAEERGPGGEPGESSRIAYLSGSVPIDPMVASGAAGAAGAGGRARSVMYDPLTKHSEMPRLVQATSRRAGAEGGGGLRSRGALAAMIAAPLLVVAVGASVFVAGSGPAALPPPVAKAAAAHAFVPVAPSPAEDLDLPDIDAETSPATPASVMDATTAKGHGSVK